jgi:hypothetical protein
LALIVLLLSDLTRRRRLQGSTAIQMDSCLG